MREILFRAKGRDGEGWRQGYYWHCEDTILCCATAEEMQENEHYYLLFDGFCDWNMPKPHYKMDIDRDTLGQYTGIKDVNGKQIFEGDIVQRDIFGNKVIGEIVWMNMGGTGFYLKVKEDSRSRFYPIGRGQYDDDDGERCNDIILGNIYDNPELIKGRR